MIAKTLTGFYGKGGLSPNIGSLGNLLAISDKEFIVIPNKPSIEQRAYIIDHNYYAFDKKWYIIYKYNIKDNKWRSHIKLKKTKQFQDNTLCKLDSTSPAIKQKYKDLINGYMKYYYNDKDKYIPSSIIGLIILFYDNTDEDIFIFESKTVTKINIVSHEMITKNYSFNLEFGGNPGVIAVNGVFHIIGGEHNNKHFEFDYDGFKMKQIYEWKSRKSIIYHGLVYIPSKNIIVMFGGHDKRQNIWLTSIWIYTLNDKKWERQIGFNIPKYIGRFGYVLSNDERYIIIICGKIPNVYNRNIVYIIDLMDTKIVENDLIHDIERIPCNAVLMPNNNIYVLYDHGQLLQIKANTFVS